MKFNVLVMSEISFKKIK